MNGTLYILLPVHNRREITRRFIQCLKEQTYSNFHLLLIDDGSTDGTEEMVRENIGSLTVMRGRGDWWWAGALHEGYKWLAVQGLNENDAVLIINDDTEFEPDFLDKGLRGLSAYPNALLLARCYDRIDNHLVDSGVHIDWKRLRFRNAENAEEINCLSTRGLFLRALDFLKLHGFMPALIPHYLSDYEFTTRAQRRGMRLITLPEVKLWLDDTATGYRTFCEEPFFSFMAKYFSKKSASYPVAHFCFIWLACPARWIPLNCARIGARIIRDLARALLYSLRQRLV